MDYNSSRLTSLRGTKLDFEEAVGQDEHEQEESGEAKLRETVDVPAQAVQQVKTYIFMNSFFASFSATKFQEQKIGFKIRFLRSNIRSRLSR